MAPHPEMATFDDFWPHYVRSHSKRSTRLLHALGVGAAASAVMVGLASRRRWLLALTPALAPVLGYGPAWLGHLVFEGNRPCTFDHPLWALRAGLRMVGMMAAGTMADEVAKVVVDGEDDTATPAATSPQADANGAASSPHRGARGGNGAGRPRPPDPHSVN
ncbi:MAG: DUF962 domain-containing protein [Deltaproteobacteria bacterium]|nr:DUF962 domain-containing protein [Deltaproteobacteria bacterium]